MITREFEIMRLKSKTSDRHTEPEATKDRWISTNPSLQTECCAGANAMDQETLWQGLWCLPSLSFACVVCWGVWVMLWCGVKLATRCWFWGLLGGIWGAGQVQPLPMSCQGTFGMSFSDLQMAITCAVRGGARERLAVASPGLGLLSERYSAWWGQMLLVWGLWTF